VTKTSHNNPPGADKDTSVTDSNEKDVAALLSRYEYGLLQYHEIHRADSIAKIYSRWPLLAETHMQ